MKKHLFDRPRNVQRLLRSFYGFLILLLLVDVLVVKHGYFPWEEATAFYAVFGFVACVVLVLLAKYVLRPLVMRREDYYD